VYVRSSSHHLYALAFPLSLIHTSYLACITEEFPISFPRTHTQRQIMQKVSTEIWYAFDGKEFFSSSWWNQKLLQVTKATFSSENTIDSWTWLNTLGWFQRSRKATERQPGYITKGAKVNLKLESTHFVNFRCWWLLFACFSTLFSLNFSCSFCICNHKFIGNSFTRKALVPKVRAKWENATLVIDKSTFSPKKKKSFVMHANYA